MQTTAKLIDKLFIQAHLIVLSRVNIDDVIIRANCHLTIHAPINSDACFLDNWLPVSTPYFSISICLRVSTDKCCLIARRCNNCCCLSVIEAVDKLFPGTCWIDSGTGIVSTAGQVARIASTVVMGWQDSISGTNDGRIWCCVPSWRPNEEIKACMRSICRWASHNGTEKVRTTLREGTGTTVEDFSVTAPWAWLVTTSANGCATFSESVCFNKAVFIMIILGSL